MYYYYYYTQDDQHAHILRPVDELGFNSGKPVWELHSVQSCGNPGVVFGDQNHEQLWSERVAMCHALGVQ